MSEISSQTTPLFCLGVTVVGLAGLLTVAAFTDTLGALTTIEEVLLGLTLIVVDVFAWRYPEEFVSTPRTEAIALAVVWTAGIVFGLYASEALAVMVWTLVGTRGWSRWSSDARRCWPGWWLASRTPIRPGDDYSEVAIATPNPTSTFSTLFLVTVGNHNGTELLLGQIEKSEASVE